MGKLRIGVTQGDIAGVGWEVILGALADPRMAELADIRVYGSKAAAEKYKALAGDEGAQGAQGATGGSGGATTKQDALGNFALVETGDVDFEPGVPTDATARAAVKALQMAVADLKKGGLDALVTAPFCKETVQSDEFGHAGHTEFLGAEFDGRPLMTMVAGGLRVALVTCHIALADVPEAISRDKISDKLRTLNDSLVRDFGIVKPRIAVLALNPHSGEGGMLGTDEAEVIKPAVEEAYRNGILAFGPMAADGLFGSGEWAKYDAVLAMYHDQGLAPFKALAPDGVNFTAGLSVVRTSPDHGTAFDIAGQGRASAGSMRAAVYEAIDIVRRRAAWAEMSKNPLKHYEREKGDERTIDFSKSEI